MTVSGRSLHTVGRSVQHNMHNITRNRLSYENDFGIPARGLAGSAFSSRDFRSTSNAIFVRSSIACWAYSEMSIYR